MFSGLTNQMSSLLSTVKGGSTDQEGVAAASETAAGDAPLTEQQQQQQEQEAMLAEAGATENAGENAAGDEKQR